MEKIYLIERFVYRIYGLFVVLILLASFLRENALYQSFITNIITPIGKLPLSSQNWCGDPGTLTFPYIGILIGLGLMLSGHLIKKLGLRNLAFGYLGLLLNIVGTLTIISTIVRCLPTIF